MSNNISNSYNKLQFLRGHYQLDKASLSKFARFSKTSDDDAQGETPQSSDLSEYGIVKIDISKAYRNWHTSELFHEGFVEFTSEALKVEDPHTDGFYYTNSRGVSVLSHDAMLRSEMNAFLSDTRALTNKYAELRKTLEEQFSGSELEHKLRVLTEAYDERVGIIADNNASWALSNTTWKMFEHLRSMGHRVSMGVKNGEIVSLSINGESVDKESLKQINQELRNFADAYRETTLSIAHLTRDYIKENGTVNSEHEIELFEQFLRSQERPENGFAFDDYNAIKDRLSQVSHNGFFRAISEIYNRTFKGMGSMIATRELLQLSG